MNIMRGCNVSSWPSGSAGIATTAGQLCQGLGPDMANERCRRASLIKTTVVYAGQSAMQLADGNACMAWQDLLYRLHADAHAAQPEVACVVDELRMCKGYAQDAVPPSVTFRMDCRGW